MQICNDDELYNYFQRKYSEVENYIKSLSDEIIMSGQDELIKNNIYEEYKIFPLNIGNEVKEKRQIKKGEVESYNPVSHLYPDYMKVPKTFKQDVVNVFCTFPYSGSKELFYYKASTSTLGGQPSIDLYEGYFILTVSFILDDMKNNTKENLEQSIERASNEVIKYINWSNSDVNDYNNKLKLKIEKCFNAKKEKSSNLYEISKVFEIPLEQRNNDLIKIIKLERNILPIETKTPNNKKDYAVSEKDYEDILDLLKHQCTTFERTPAVYNKIGEEDLRDILLSALNCVYKGNASGECFRKKGKTDICIEYENRAAFVTECKLWNGKKTLYDALDQLQSYLTWRDTKTSLILFSKNKNFFSVLEEIKLNLTLIENYIRFAEIEKNIFELIVKSKNNNNQSITITVMAFDISLN